MIIIKYLSGDPVFEVAMSPHEETKFLIIIIIIIIYIYILYTVRSRLACPRIRTQIRIAEVKAPSVSG